MKTKIAVRCSSKEQKQQVIKYSGREWSPCEEHECVNLNDGCHQTEQWYSEDGYKVISFEEFEQKYLGKSPKTEFIPGKWYKAEGYNYYGKFKSIVKPRDHFHVSEGIVVATFIKDYSFEPGYTWTLVKEQEDILWLDKCSEANKFIPKEEALKPKEMEMIEGKWYKLVLNSGSINWLFKYTKGSNRTNSSKYIDLDSNIKGINNYIDSDTNIVNIEPANMEEVYKHFPEERQKEAKPELSKWYVVPETEENLSLIEKYFNNYKFKDFVITYPDNAYSSDGIYYTHESEVPSEFVKITMDQFKKEILKQEKPMKEEYCLKLGEEYLYASSPNIWVVDKITDTEVGFYKKGRSTETANYSKSQFPGLLNSDQFHKVEKKVMEEESLLIESKRRYPIGTSYIPLTLEGKPYDGIVKISENPPRNIELGGIDVGFGYVYSYATRTWAEIVDSEDVQVGKGVYEQLPREAYIGDSMRSSITLSPTKQAPAIIQPVLKNLEENDERIDSSINRILSVSNNLVLEEV